MSKFLSKRFTYILTLFFVVGFLGINYVGASSGEESASGGGVNATIFLWIAIILLCAKFSSFVETLGQPIVLGELLIGVIIGNLRLLGVHFFDPIVEDSIIEFLAELGVVILLFQIGLESNIGEMRRVGLRAFLVAIVGVVVPFFLGTWVIGPWLFPELSTNAHLFLGATLTATSVGITGRVFKDLGKLKTREAQIVLGAAVVDDILGLIILAVVTAIVITGSVTTVAVGFIIGKSVLFLVGAILVGQFIAPKVSHLFSKIHTGVGMKFTIAISFGLIFAYLAGLVGLAPIVGAFAAGLILDPVHFRYFKDPKVIDDIKEVLEEVDVDSKKKIITALNVHSHRHLEDIIEPVGYFLIPIFFVLTGMNVNLETFTNPKVVLMALVVTVIAFVGKLVAGSVAGSVRKWVVGWGMVPRGEVGLIFATVGRSIGVVSEEVYSVVVIMVILTTLLTPPILTAVLKRNSKIT